KISPELFQLSPEVLEKYHGDIFQKLVMRFHFDTKNTYNRSFCKCFQRNFPAILTLKVTFCKGEFGFLTALVGEQKGTGGVD
ncbi:MAG: hypothetical protein Q4E59_04775, partial [Bacteroidales bacterium]|nr:hypothetical protein [Bacteroidales bacterium]